MPLGAGDLRDSVRFQSRDVVDDGFGNMVPGGEFLDRFRRSVNLRPRLGGEAVSAARLEGRQPFILTVRRGGETLQVTPAWRIVDARNSDRVFAIVSPLVDPDGTRAWLEMLVIEGGES